ncbi:MAG: L-sorbosone dehydrogenase [Acidobacteria bacterium RIFCSPLOWO2_12_FULL_54_10]|nr:MAG: L-sorbosone dehydrogenase [Acidobacteria bacterium RIFCSPLOWO2_12_FULL_54_10]
MTGIQFTAQKRLGSWLAATIFVLTASGCGSSAQQAASVQAIESGPSEQISLPAPFATPSVRNASDVIGWPAGRMPTAPPGFQVNLFAEDLNNPRWIYVLPNADVLVAETIRERIGSSRSGNRIVLFRDRDKDGKPELREIFLSDLNMPFGMLLLGDWFYVANTDSLVRYPYQAGQTRIAAKPEKILDLPAGGHFTRHVVIDPDHLKLYVSVGSRTNVDEEGVDAEDPRRAAILELNPDGSQMRVFASGLRNPVGMDWEPETKTLWAVVNERDGLGDQLVPDYLTSVKEGSFYGWPYSYYGQNEDPRKKGQRPDLVSIAIKPDFALGSHVAPLGMTFYTGSTFPSRFHGGAFIGMHGSWNRSKFVGYKVAFVPFQNGKPSGPLEDFLTGYIANENESEVFGRPVGVTVWHDGSLLVADDAGNKVWRVSARIGDTR